MRSESQTVKCLCKEIILHNESTTSYKNFNICWILGAFIRSVPKINTPSIPIKKFRECTKQSSRKRDESFQLASSLNSGVVANQPSFDVLCLLPSGYDVVHNTHKVVLDLCRFDNIWSLQL